MMCSILNWEILFTEGLLSIIVGVLFGYLVWGRKKDIKKSLEEEQ